MTLADAMNKSVAAKNISETAAQIIRLLEKNFSSTLKTPAECFKYSDDATNGSGFGSGIVLEEYRGSPPIIDIPSQIDGLPVVEIAKEAFGEHMMLKEINLPDTVKEIESFAFYKCKSLRRIHLSASLKYIGVSVFYGCTSLEKINLPDSVEIICGSAFCDCKSLTRVNIPDGVTFIGSDAFKNCISLEEFRLPSALERINDYGLGTCKSLRDFYVPKILLEGKLAKDIKKIIDSLPETCIKVHFM